MYTCTFEVIAVFLLTCDVIHHFDVIHHSLKLIYLQKHLQILILNVKINYLCKINKSEACTCVVVMSKVSFAFVDK